MKKKVVLSGIRATGHLHLGNYLGVLEHFAALSNDDGYQCYFFIADLHTLTTFKEAQLIGAHAPNIVLDMLAAGVNPDRAVIYAQSSVPSVAELAWYLACITAAGDLQRMPTFKDKSSKQPEDVNAGLLFYPVLMAADILGPRAECVPVGEDQRPHLELTRQIASKFNRLYGDFFPIPEDLGAEMISVPGLVAMDEQGRFAKMGKSETPNTTIMLSDTQDEVNAKVMAAPTDPARIKRTDPGTPEKCAIYQFHTLLSSEDDLRWASEGCRSAAIGCTDCKRSLLGNLEARLAPFRVRRQQLAAQPNFVLELLGDHGATARRIFDETTSEVGRRMGALYAARR